MLPGNVVVVVVSAKRDQKMWLLNFVVVFYESIPLNIYQDIVYYIISKQRAVKIQIHLSSFYYLLATSLQNQVRKGEKTKTN